MTNPKIAPAEFEEFSARLLDTINESQQLPEKLQETDSLQQLNRLIEMAKETRRVADEKYDLWAKFKALRDTISDKQDAIQQSYDELQGLGPVKDLNDRIKKVEVSS